MSKGRDVKKYKFSIELSKLKLTTGKQRWQVNIANKWAWSSGFFSMLFYVTSPHVKICSNFKANLDCPV